jgi:hypothetical protein
VLETISTANWYGSIVAEQIVLQIAEIFAPEAAAPEVAGLNRTIFMKGISLTLGTIRKELTGIMNIRGVISAKGDIRTKHFRFELRSQRRLWQECRCM